MEFRTRVQIAPFGRKLDYSSKGLSIGSCFAENVARKLSSAKFDIICNPFGVLFNPASMADTLHALAKRREFKFDDLICRDGIWGSLAFHGRFSSSTAEDALLKMNEAVNQGSDALAEADYVMLTFGTAWIYELSEAAFEKTGEFSINSNNKPGNIVANCHKLPHIAFVRRRLSIDEIIRSYSKLLDNGGPLASKNIIITVSPVRHIKDGLPENNLSKATLLLATHELTKRYGNVSYFPAYEIVNDELRDYRFYDSDMAHPSNVTVDYIWELFRDSVLSPEATRIAMEIEKIFTAISHRPINPDSEEHCKFLDSMYNKICGLQIKYPQIDLTAETEYFKRR